jgi:hypothetical protein
MIRVALLINPILQPPGKVERTEEMAQTHGVRLSDFSVGRHPSASYGTNPCLML